MENATPSHDFTSASEAAAAASLPTNNVPPSVDVESAQGAPISALAIEAQHGKFGCAVFEEEDHQLLLCEDLSCDFAFDDRDQPEPILVQAAADPDEDVAEQQEPAQDVNHNAAHGVADGASTAFGHASFGFVESCKHTVQHICSRASCVPQILKQESFVRIVQAVLAQYEPDLIVVSSRCPESFLVMLQNYGKSSALSLMQVRYGGGTS